ncbi:Uncharacterised protein [Mycobacteroides abscessus subsp. abscessus]|nr:Uncharacterised protein [Mycobacteroides abscessus subsp. abscessus]
MLWSRTRERSLPEAPGLDSLLLPPNASCRCGSVMRVLIGMCSFSAVVWVGPLVVSEDLFSQ